MFNFKKKHETAHHGIGKLGKGVAALAAAATLSAGFVPLAMATGGSGSGEGGGGGLSASLFWQYRDNGNTSFGPATQFSSVQAAFDAAHIRLAGNGITKAQNALAGALKQCEDTFKQYHPNEGAADCRVVAVGAVYATGTDTYDGTGYMLPSVWKDKWNEVIAPNTYSHGTQSYKVNYPFEDDKNMSVTKLMDEEADKGNTGVIVIALNKYQPMPPVVDYDLTVTTNVNAPQDLKAGSTGAVTDTIHANQSAGDVENVNAKVIMHYDGNDYVGAKTAEKTVSIKSKGDTTTPQFKPSDFGWQSWPAGTYWFDVQVAKQGNMKAAVDTADREASESFRITEVPPEPPVKKIQDGVSADQMRNQTTITSGTGRGGYYMKFTDTITPNGVKYTVENMKVTDLTTKQDVSGQFTFNWDKAANVVTAERTKDKGEMPHDHEWAFTLDIVANLPDINKVQDVAKVMWNKTEQVTEGKEFPTWKPNPDKSWIKLDASGKWAAVIDPEETNSTGADKNVFLDGDKVASVVNGTLAANLIEAPKSFSLMDDWTKADYIFDADTKNVKVYMADASTDTASSVFDIVNKGKDVTGEFDIKVEGTKATAVMKADKLGALKGLAKPRQYTLLIPGSINFANGKGASQVREDFGKKAGEELTFCEIPGSGDAANGHKLTNSGAQTVNGDTEETNKPWICGYVPPVVKDVVSEASEGGSQESVDGKVVFPGQKVEYLLTTTPKLPANLAYDVTNVVVTDRYDQYLVPDKQTVEVTDLGNGRVIPKSQYTTKWDDDSHMFQLAFDDSYVRANWGKGMNPRVLIRFEGTVADDAPTDKKVDNQWMLTLNNSLTPSNKVFNTPPTLIPTKEDTQKDATINIDGKTALLGDQLYYRINLDLKNLDRKDTAYNVMRAGIIDDYDDEYLTADEKGVEVLNAKGEDVTGKFNVQFKDGVAYVFAKTVDTKVPATGETLKGDPQPDDLKAYSEAKLDPLKDAAIDQSLLGQTYQVVLPMTVTKVTDGYVVENTATQLVNDVKKTTNTVTNPLKPINPAKDVVLKVNGDSVNGKDVALGKKFLYRLDSSVLPVDRAYPEVTDWQMVDTFDTEHDKYLGQWAVYANADLYKGDVLVAKKGEMLAGSGFDNTQLMAAINGTDAAGSKTTEESETEDTQTVPAEQLFTVDWNDETGTITVKAAEPYLKLVSDSTHEAAWSFFPFMQRVATSERVENKFTETFNGKELVSNTVWTRTPDLKPSLHIEKWDKKSGWPNGDRDTREQALKDAQNGDTIVFTITNTSKVDKDGTGAIFQTKDLKLEDQTTLGSGKVVDLKYPDDWATRTLKPGESVDVEGVLKDVKGEHTDRANVSGIPLTPCVVNDDTPFDGKDDETMPEGAIDVDGKMLCGGERVVSNTDDWNATVTPPLAMTGGAVAGIALLAAVCAAGGVGIVLVQRRRKANVRGAHRA